MAIIDEIVKVNILRSAPTLIRPDFGTILIVGDSLPAMVTNPSIVTSLKEVIDLGFVDNSPEYNMIKSIFSQSPRPARAIILQKKATDTSFLAAYTAYAAGHNDFYYVGLTSLVNADILAIAGQIETEDKMFSISSHDAAIKDPASTTDIAYLLKQLNYDHTVSMYVSQQVQWGNLAWTSLMSSYDPGTAEWAYKHLSGIHATTNLTATDRSAIAAKNSNYYVDFAGSGSTFTGVTVSGKRIYTITGLHWLKAEIQYSLALVFKTLPIVIFNNAGLGAIENSITSSLQIAKDRNVITDYKIHMPNLLSISSADKAAGILKVSCDIALAQSILKLEININVTN